MLCAWPSLKRVGVILPGAQRSCSSFFERKDPQTTWPSRWTVCEILKREGLVRKKTRRRKVGHPGKPTSIITAPNELWCVDFKGEFKTRDGRYCYPLTVTDSYSRYLIGCQGLLSTETLGAKEVFARLFKKYGLPAAISSDNGTPFASTALGRLSQLSVWWIRLGITPGVDRTGQAATKRAARTNASDTESRDNAPA